MNSYQMVLELNKHLFQVKNCMTWYQNMMTLYLNFDFQSGKYKFSGFDLTHNWVKQSILWELSYWKTNLLRHNLDVVHIKKNVYENIFNTVMDLKENTNDNINARMDITFFFCHRKNMELVYVGSYVTKPTPP
jgi:hypothetical protein